MVSPMVPLGSDMDDMVVSVVPISEDTWYDHGNYPSMVQSLLRAWTVRGDHGRCSFRCALVRSFMDDTAETYICDFSVYNCHFEWSPTNYGFIFASVR